MQQDWAADDTIALRFLDRLFPAGPFAADVLTELRSDGWPDAGDDVRSARVLGEAIWAVISDNNDVIDATGSEVPFGTWRGGADIVCQFLNARVHGADFEYMDFYMCGEVFREPPMQRANVLAAVRMVFRRLRRHGVTWRCGSSYTDVPRAFETVMNEKL